VFYSSNLLTWVEEKLNRKILLNDDFFTEASGFMLFVSSMISGLVIHIWSSRKRMFVIT
jgi:hypothetical protein